MKQLLAIAFMALPLFLHAQDKEQLTTEALLNKANIAPANINWSAMINRDFVCIRESKNVMFNTNVLSTEWIVQVRFYDAGMKPLIDVTRDGGTPLSFTKAKDSRVIDVRGLSDGGIGVILATADRQGPFIETIMLTGFYNYIFSIQGLVQTDSTQTSEK